MEQRSGLPDGAIRQSREWLPARRRAAELRLFGALCFPFLLAVLCIAISSPAVGNTNELAFVEVLRDGIGGVDGLDAPRLVVVSPNGDHLYAAASADDAVVVFSRNPTNGRLTSVEVLQDGVGGVDGLDGAFSVAVSPDGGNVYAAGKDDNAVAVFSRDPVSGQLTFLEVHRTGTNGVNGLSNARSLTVSPDGAHLYAVGTQDDSVAAFRRNPSTGRLSYMGVRRDGVGGVDGLDGVLSVTVSPDGNHLYAGGYFDDAVAVFGRNPTNGRLTFVEVHKDGVGGVDGLDGASTIAVSPDGAYLYAVGGLDNAVAIFSRDAATGQLTFMDALVDGVDGIDGLAGARSVTVSPDGHRLYVAAVDDNAVAVFSRDVETGGLTFMAMLQDGVDGVDGLEGAFSVAMSPNGHHLYAAALDGDAVTVLRRGLADWQLTFVEALKDGDGVVDGLRSVRSVAVSPDGNHLYAASAAEDMVVVFRRDAATGRLMLVELLQDGVDGVDGLDYASAVAVSSDGEHVYVVSAGDAAVAVFTRNPPNGRLTFVEALKDGVGGVTGLEDTDSVTMSPDGAHLYAAGLTDDAVVAFNRDAATGRLTSEQVLVDGAGGVVGLQNARAVAVSPDGAHLYAAAANDNSVVLFRRNAANGHLIFIEMLQDGVGGVDGLASARAVAVSPDGSHLYAAGAGDEAVAVFGRNPVSGQLTFIEMLQDGVGGMDGLSNAQAVAVSPDGASVYAVGSGDDAVAVFTRDPASGRLTFVEAHRDGIGGVDGLDGASAVTVSPDGAHVYATGAPDHAVAVFVRDPASGQLTFIEVLRDGVGGVNGLAGARSVAVSPDGASVYVAGYAEHAVAIFSRDPVTGRLTYVEKLRDGVDGVEGLNYVQSVAVSPDGAHVYAASSGDDAVAVFTRGAASGRLTFKEAVKDGVGGVDGLDGAGSVAVSRDGADVYVASLADNAVAVFSRHYEDAGIDGDTDGDGIPDWWEILYYGGPTNANPTAICSNDVNIVIEAYIAGLDPTDPNARFSLLILGNELAWGGVSGRVYDVWWTSNLFDGFLPLETNIPWTTDNFIDTFHGIEDTGYYRLRVRVSP